MAASGSKSAGSIRRRFSSIRRSILPTSSANKQEVVDKTGSDVNKPEVVDETGSDVKEPEVAVEEAHKNYSKCVCTSLLGNAACDLFNLMLLASCVND